MQRAHDPTKTFQNRHVGPITLDCDALRVPDRDQHLVLFTAAARTPAAEALALIEVVGTQTLHAGHLGLSD